MFCLLPLAKVIRRALSSFRLQVIYRTVCRRAGGQPRKMNCLTQTSSEQKGKQICIILFWVLTRQAQDIQEDELFTYTLLEQSWPKPNYFCFLPNNENTPFLWPNNLARDMITFLLWACRCEQRCLSTTYVTLQKMMLALLKSSWTSRSIRLLNISSFI